MTTEMNPEEFIRLLLDRVAGATGEEREILEKQIVQARTQQDATDNPDLRELAKHISRDIVMGCPRGEDAAVRIILPTLEQAFKMGQESRDYEVVRLMRAVPKASVESYKIGQESRDSDWASAFVGWGLNDSTEEDTKVHIARTPEELGESLDKTRADGIKLGLERAEELCERLNSSGVIRCDTQDEEQREWFLRGEEVGFDRAKEGCCLLIAEEREKL